MDNELNTPNGPERPWRLSVPGMVYFSVPPCPTWGVRQWTERTRRPTDSGGQISKMDRWPPGSTAEKHETMTHAERQLKTGNCAVGPFLAIGVRAAFWVF